MNDPAYRGVSESFIAQKTKKLNKRGKIMALQATQNHSSAYEVQLDTTSGSSNTLDTNFINALNRNLSITGNSAATTGEITSVDVVVFADSNKTIQTFLNDIATGNDGSLFDPTTDSRFFINRDATDAQILNAIKNYLNSTLATSELKHSGTAEVNDGAITLATKDGSEDSTAVLGFFNALKTDDSVYGTVFDLNSMSDMSRVPADNYAIALENLRAIGTNSSMGIAELTQATTDVQVESGKLEMINGVVKNAVNYLNTRARALTS